jgi:hypothetical protein
MGALRIAAKIRFRLRAQPVNATPRSGVSKRRVAMASGPRLIAWRPDSWKCLHSRYKPTQLRSRTFGELPMQAQVVAMSSKTVPPKCCVDRLKRQPEADFPAGIMIITTVRNATPLAHRHRSALSS